VAGVTALTASPRIDDTIGLQDGRSLAYAESGDTHGQPVFLSIQVRLRAASNSYVLFDSYGLYWPRLPLWITLDKLECSGGVAQW
jgi:hypothetical protein